MRILFSIPHYFNPKRKGCYNSLNAAPEQRLRALNACLSAVLGHFSAGYCFLNHLEKNVTCVPLEKRNQIQIILLTTKDEHLVFESSIASRLCIHHITNVDPRLLGFECWKVLREQLGKFDYYCYLEDDLLIHDPWFFLKLMWFTRQTDNSHLLLPNRYEMQTLPHPLKVYIDGDLRADLVARYQDLQRNSSLSCQILRVPTKFVKPTNPHSGCFFLNAEQMQHWSDQPHFLDSDTSFIGPLESAATLGVLKTFSIYKPSRHNPEFLEVQHFGSSYLSLLNPSDTQRSDSA